MTTTLKLAESVVDLVRGIYGEGFIPLHRPILGQREKEYLAQCIDSNFVSSVGELVADFEAAICRFTGAGFAVATVNGTAALHVALQVAGVRRDDEVISQAVTFVATCNALSYAGARPVFVDVDEDTLSLSPDALRAFLKANAQSRDGVVWNRRTGRRIAACVPMHTFGFPARIAEIVAVCDEFEIPVVEDAAESLGSWVGGRHTGTFGRMATLSFNGNKITTTGGGGMVITDDADVASRVKHLTTTAKVPHPYEFVHDVLGYNYRLPNLNAALGCAQMERLPLMLNAKSDVAASYRDFFSGTNVRVVDGLRGADPNYWLNTIVLDSRRDRDEFLLHTNAEGVMTRPMWALMSGLPMYAGCQNDGLAVSRWLEDRVVNLPSSVPGPATGWASS